MKSNMSHTIRIGLITAALFGLASSLSLTHASDSNDERKILDFHTMVGVPKPFTGADNAIRGVPGGFLPWVVGSAQGTLRTDGEIEVRVRGLVFDPNDPDVIARGLAGKNTLPTFKVIVSCLSIDEHGNAVTVNLETKEFPADAAGNSRIRDRVDLPMPCIAPIVFVTTAAGAWLASTGF
jgi:hypothetical protein